MAKMLIIALVIVLAVLGYYFYNLQKNSAQIPVLQKNGTTIATETAKNTTAEEDLTALEKDLLELENSEKDSLKEINGL